MSDSQILSRASERGHLQGPGNAPVTMVVYGDFECGQCARLSTLLDPLVGEFGPELDMVFKYFPLQDKHRHAMAAAQAAEAAAWQGKFWEMHDLLFQHQQALEPDDLQRYAEQIGLNADQFAADFSRRELIASIERDINQGFQNGVTSTPTIFINGEKYTLPLEPEALKGALHRARGAHATSDR